MTVSLVRGQKVNFTKEYPSMKKLDVNLQWSTKQSSGSIASELELDASVFLLDDAGKCRGDQDMIFYGNANGYNGAVLHEGKQQKGALVGEGLTFDLEKIPLSVDKMAVTLTIYEGAQRAQAFSMVENISLSVRDKLQNTEVCRFNVDWNFTVETAIVVCELYRKNGEWRLSAVGAGYQGGLAALCGSFGIEVEEDNEITPSPTSPPPLPHLPPPLCNTAVSLGGHCRNCQKPLRANRSYCVYCGTPQAKNNPAPRGINLGNPITQIALPNVAGKDRLAPINLSLPTLQREAVRSSSVPPALSVCKCGAAVKIGAKFCTSCGTPA